MNCIICNTPLAGRQKKFCSRKCNNKDINRKHKIYELQQHRGKSRKLKLLEILGGACGICGYRKNYSALTFHHKDPSKKLFGIDLRQCSNRSWKVLKTEVAKCSLLCHNCHNELHHPQCAL
jgi:hypothetical protein